MKQTARSFFLLCSITNDKRRKEPADDAAYLYDELTQWDRVNSDYADHIFDSFLLLYLKTSLLSPTLLFLCENKVKAPFADFIPL